MFRHKDRGRTFAHNLRLATLLSFVAGIVNIVGVLSVQVLTTNVTGHFAFWVEELLIENYHHAFVFLLYIIAFLAGSFFSNLAVELLLRRNSNVSHAIPMFVEIILLSAVALQAADIFSPQAIACILLFSMGLQNSLVTKVSNSTVRTTHLTGLFTDLGIELSQLFFYRQPNKMVLLKKSIFLRLVIIFCFFLGCIIGGYVYKHIAYKALLLAAGVLALAMYYDMIRYRLYQIKRKVF